MTAYPTLGFDPVASDESVSAQIGTKLRETARRLGEVDAVLSGTGSQRWEGEAAEAFRGSVDDELRPRVTEAYQGFSAASRAWDRWVDDLPGYRRRADALEEEAAEAVRRVSSAARSLDGLTEPPVDATPQERDAYDGDLRDARASVRGAQGALTEILGRARALRAEVVESATLTAGSLQTAMETAPDEPGLFDKLGEWVGDAWDNLGKAFDWVMENVAPILQKLAKIVGAVCTILSIVAFVAGFVFPPAFALAGTLGTVAKVASFVDLGIQGLRVLHGEEGALAGFALSAGGMLLGIGAAKAIGPIAVNATSNIRNGLFVPQLAMVNVGSRGGGAVAAMSFQINSDFFSSLLYWGITSQKDLSDSAGTLEEELR